MRQDSDAEAIAAAEAQRAKIDAATKADAARANALVKAREDAQRTRENIIALAAVLLVAGALAVGGAGFLELRGKRQPALWVAGGAALAFVAALAIFLMRPSGEPVLPAVLPTPAPTVNSDEALGKLVCTVVPQRSRVTVSSLADVQLDWQDGGCMNGRTQYAENGSKWDRILVPSEDQTVSVLQFDPATKLYSNTRYLLSAQQIDAARKIRSQVTLKACSPDIAARANLSTQQAAIRGSLPSLPNERIVYSCKPAL